MTAASESSAVNTRPPGAEIEDENREAAMAGEPPFKTHPTARQDLLAAALKEAAIAAFITLALAGPLIGLKTEPAVGGLTLVQRWTPVAVAVAIVFVGRLLLRLFVWPAAGVERRPAWYARLGVALPPATGRVAVGALFLVGLLLPFLVMWLFPSYSRQFIDLGLLILTYIMLGWGLNIVVGLAGLLDLGYVAFYAVGAYSYALIALHFGWSFWVCLPIAGLLAALWGIALGFPVLRLRGDYLAIVTLAFGEIIRLVLINWQELTNGPVGLSRIPRPSFFGLEFVPGPGGFADYFGIDYKPIHRIVFFYYILLALALFTNFVTIRLRRLPVGRAWEALREDEIACRSLGINTTNTKLTAFAIGAMFGGFAGSFFATRQGFISPESFNFTESATIVAIVVLGGLGSQIGIVISSVVLIGGLELLRNIGFLKAIFGPDFDPTQYRLLIFGLAMVFIMVWRPRGLIATRLPSVFLKERRAVSAEFVGEGRG
jgi:branched-chain amino acid transport system permease protein